MEVKGWRVRFCLTSGRRQCVKYLAAGRSSRGQPGVHFISNAKGPLLSSAELGCTFPRVSSWPEHYWLVPLGY